MDGLHQMAHPKSSQTPASVCSMNNSTYTFRNTHNPNTITCMAGGEEMLRVASDGFWVRGKKVKQDDTEAEAVYNAFKDWMIWSQLNKDYR
jgi:uncharacterized protein YaiE (UPF0345 family)